MIPNILLEVQRTIFNKSLEMSYSDSGCENNCDILVHWLLKSVHSPDRNIDIYDQVVYCLPLHHICETRIYWLASTGVQLHYVHCLTLKRSFFHISFFDFFSIAFSSQAIRNCMEFNSQIDLYSKPRKQTKKQINKSP